MQETAPRSKAWDTAIACLVLAGLVSIFSTTVADPDLWGHVLYGVAHLQDGSLARTDPYSYMTAGHEWINHEVLSELVFGFLFSTFGALGLIVFKTALALVIVGLLYRHLWREGLGPLRAGFVVLVASFALVVGLVTVRPQMFTHLFFTLLMLALVGGEERNPGRLWWIPLILLLWINFHGGVLAGLGILIVWSVAHVAVHVGRRWLDFGGEPRVGPVRAVGITLIAAAALLVNPYGWELPEFLFRTATVPRPEIIDWRPLTVGSFQGAVYLLLVGTAAFALIRSERPKNLPLLVVLLVTAVMPLLAVRHLQLFAIAFVALVGGHLADAWNGLRAAGSDRRPSPAASRLRPAFVAVALLTAVALIASSAPNLRCLRIDPVLAMGFPARATTVLQESGASGRLALPFGWGQYAIWHLYPAMQVSMDGRRETAYPEDVYARYLMFHRGAGEWSLHLDDPPADVALLPTGSPAYNLVSLREDWRLAYRDDAASIFVREQSSGGAVLLDGGPVQGDLEAIPADGTGLCFP